MQLRFNIKTGQFEWDFRVVLFYFCLDDEKEGELHGGEKTYK